MGWKKQKMALEKVLLYPTVKCTFRLFFCILKPQEKKLPSKPLSKNYHSLLHVLKAGKRSTVASLDCRECDQPIPIIELNTGGNIFKPNSMNTSYNSNLEPRNFYGQYYKIAKRFVKVYVQRCN